MRDTKVQDRFALLVRPRADLPQDVFVQDQMRDDVCFSFTRRRIEDRPRPPPEQNSQIHETIDREEQLDLIAVRAPILVGVQGIAFCLDPLHERLSQNVVHRLDRDVTEMRDLPVDARAPFRNGSVVAVKPQKLVGALRERREQRDIRRIVRRREPRHGKREHERIGVVSDHCT